MKFTVLLCIFMAYCGQLNHTVGGRATHTVEVNLKFCDKLPDRLREKCIMKVVQVAENYTEKELIETRLEVCMAMKDKAKKEACLDEVLTVD